MTVPAPSGKSKVKRQKAKVEDEGRRGKVKTKGSVAFILGIFGIFGTLG
jgi:hypothetical protein